MPSGNTLAQPVESSDQIYRPLERGERNPAHDIMIWFAGFCFSIPFAIPVCTGLCLSLLKCYHSSCTGSSLPPLPHRWALWAWGGKGREDRSNIIQLLCCERWIVGLWSFTSRRGQSTPLSGASLLGHALLSQEWLFLWWQLSLLHGCDTAGNEITYLPGSAKIEPIPTPVQKQLMGNGNSVPGLSTALLGQQHEGRVAGRCPVPTIDPHIAHKDMDC